MEEKRRFAVLLCAEDPEYVKETYGGYFGVFQNLLAEDGEAWDLYRVVEGDFPRTDFSVSTTGSSSPEARTTHMATTSGSGDCWVC
ncbi:hypothetical protein QJS10_CPB13g00267 [Acorus calamus]|uniref:Uncharacterized protein n=1 Tax=Acorus calamus TaxID=4465 RepID=A0AAV9DFP0_ACOCL|nr:hypothetical protein QJS10_CPB13g00267 [Acorus calamus]